MGGVRRTLGLIGATEIETEDLIIAAYKNPNQDDGSGFLQE